MTFLHEALAQAHPGSQADFASWCDVKPINTKDIQTHKKHTKNTEEQKKS